MERADQDGRSFIVLFRFFGLRLVVFTLKDFGTDAGTGHREVFGK